MQFMQRMAEGTNTSAITGELENGVGVPKAGDSNANIRYDVPPGAEACEVNGPHDRKVSKRSFSPIR